MGLVSCSNLAAQEYRSLAQLYRDRHQRLSYACGPKGTRTKHSSAEKSPNVLFTISDGAKKEAAVPRHQPSCPLVTRERLLRLREVRHLPLQLHG